MMNASVSETAGTPPSNHVRDFVNAFRAGQTLATPQGDVKAPLDEFTNAITGRLALADPAQTRQAARRAELLGAIGAGLGRVPYCERPAILAHLTPVLIAEGIPASAIAKFDPTDEALSLSVDQARAAKALIDAA
jgi:hypothetical protein